MPYLYKSTIYFNVPLIDSIGADETAEATNQSDFETNHKDNATEVSAVAVEETTFETDKIYDDFVALVVSPIVWSDVKFIENGNKYTLHLISDTPL